ncbi:MAG: hypothetical protein MPJ25_06840 [Pirellulales bacterium]|nr:hypothetical protein [Pirellulales bacterium]
MKIIKAAEAALVELEKVARQVIDLSELDPEKAKTAAAAKKQAIFDAFEIIERIEDEKTLLEDKNKPKEEKTEFFGVESKIR